MSYSAQFFRAMSASARDSAQVIVPILIDLIDPKSVVDVGCGSGTWLSVFQELGIKDYLGVDGEYVQPDMLQIPKEHFVAHDLACSFTLDRRFDLVVCLEVAEHLPASRADTLVQDLTSLGSIVVFSAAIPFQGGTHHVNEQWPDYWVSRFAALGFHVVDCLRWQIWENEKVSWFYAQNAVLFATSNAIESVANLRRAVAESGSHPLAVVHPRRYLDGIDDARRLSHTAHDMAMLLTPGAPFILVDQDEVRTQLTAGAHAIPFLEIDGSYAGVPADDDLAIRECERLRQNGVEHIVFVWSAFWWLDYYRAFAMHLSSRYRCAIRNERIIAFDLRRQCE